jgi:hypothetical protein
MVLTTVGARSRNSERGAVAVLVGILAVVLFGLAALVVNLGLARDTRREAQNAADAAALAAANNLYLSGPADTTAAINAAKQSAADNYGTTTSEWASCTDPTRPAGFSAIAGQTACISFDALPSPSEVRVVVPSRDVATPFASVFDVMGGHAANRVAVAALAQARLTPGGKASCGLCVIGPGTHDIQNGNIAVDGADVYINGTTDAGPNGAVIASSGGEIYLQGTKPSKGTFDPAPETNQPAIADPLSFLTLPPDMSALTAKTASACGTGSSHGPGIYKSLGISGACTLQPGLYVVTGTNHLSGQEVVTASGVTLYFTCQDSSTSTPNVRACNANESGGDLLMTGQSILNITAPTTGPTAGLAIVSDRNNTAEMGWRGDGSLQSTGTIYLQNGTLNYRGNGAGLALDSLIVLGNLDFNGNPSQFKTMYSQSKNVQLPPGALYLSK